MALEDRRCEVRGRSRSLGATKVGCWSWAGREEDVLVCEPGRVSPAGRVPPTRAESLIVATEARFALFASSPGGGMYCVSQITDAWIEGGVWYVGEGRRWLYHGKYKVRGRWSRLPTWMFGCVPAPSTSADDGHETETSAATYLQSAVDASIRLPAGHKHLQALCRRIKSHMIIHSDRRRRISRRLSAIVLVHSVVTTSLLSV